MPTKREANLQAVKPEKSEANLPPVEPEEGPYKDIREMNAKDTQAVASMIAKVTGDPRLQNAVSSGDQSLILMTLVACLMDRAMRELALLVADLVGLSDGYSMKEYRRAERALAREENRLPDADADIRRAMEDDILEELGSYPPNVHIDVATEIMTRPSFDGFLASTKQLAAATQSISSRFTTPSSNGSGSPKKK